MYVYTLNIFKEYEKFTLHSENFFLLMKSNFAGFLLVASLVLSSILNAQTTTISESKRADVNFKDLVEYSRLHPEPFKIKLPIEEEEEESRPAHRRANPSEVKLYKPPVVSINPDDVHVPMLPSSPAPDDTFQSTISPGSAIPPDTHGAVDSQYAVTTINTTVHIQDRIGGNISSVSLTTFWSSVLPSGTSPFDPRVHYDPNYRRWICVTDAVTDPAHNNSTLLVAVSATNDPTGTWHMYAFPIDPTGAAWLDYPNVGYNSKWIVVTGNMFPNSAGGASGAVVYIYNYADLMAGLTTTATKISMSSSFTICPAVTHDANQPSVFCLETWSGTNGQLNLWKISGPVSTPTMTHIAYPASPTHWKRNGGSSDFGPQSTITNKIDLGDDRIHRVVYRNGKLWTSHNAFLPATGTLKRCSAMWWQVDTLGNPLQIGFINDPNSINFYCYPSIEVNKYDDMLIGCSQMSASMHPSAAYALRMHTDAIDSIRPAQIFRHGLASYYTTFGGTKNRWGDYSACVIDPRNDEDFWTIEEASATGTSANWDTWWANVQICPKPQAPTFSFSGAAPCQGDTVSYVINPVPGATSYTWGVAGTGWSGSSTTTSILLTAGSVTGTVFVYATNGCGQGESRTVYITPTPLPSAPSISTISAACIGSPTATFSAASSGASGYNWTVTGTGWSGTSGSATFTPTVGTGPGTIICKAWNACGYGPADTLVVTPAAMPITNFVVSTHSTVTYANVVFTSTGTTPAGATITWNFGGGTGTPGTGTVPQSVFWSTTGTKTVTLTVDNSGCSSSHSDTVHVGKNAGIGAVTGSNGDIDIIPNPNEGSFDILFDQNISKPVTVRMTDMQGRVMINKEFNGTTDKKLPIAAENLPAGIYAVSVYIDGEVVTKKVTINR